MIASTTRLKKSFSSLSLGLLLAVVAASATSPALAQQSAADMLTPEFLVGNAVSLSNRNYPEIENAIQRFRNGDVSGAIDYLDQAKEKYPQLPPTDVTLAKMQMLARNAQAVQFLLERAVTQHPEDPEAYIMLADQAFASQRTAEADALYHMVEPIVEDFSANEKRKRNFEIRVLAGKASVAERRGKWEQAFDLFSQFVERDPDNASAIFRLGRAHFNLDRPQEALAQFRKAREINPDITHPFVALGQLFASKDNTEMARKSFDRAYQENQSDVNVVQSYAEWLIRQGDLEKAQQLAEELKNNNPDSVVAHLLDGVVAFMRNEINRAEQAMQRVLSLDPRNARATDLLALILIESENTADHQRALSHAQNNVERLENNAQANITLGWVLYNLGQKSEAQTALQRGAQGGQQLSADSLYLIARIMMEEGNADQALLALQQAETRERGLEIYSRQADELRQQLGEQTP